jgi:hypothetical protein
VFLHACSISKLDRALLIIVFSCPSGLALTSLGLVKHVKNIDEEVKALRAVHGIVQVLGLESVSLVFLGVKRPCD